VTKSLKAACQNSRFQGRGERARADSAWPLRDAVRQCGSLTQNIKTHREMSAYVQLLLQLATASGKRRGSEWVGLEPGQKRPAHPWERSNRRPQHPWRLQAGCKVGTKPGADKRAPGCGCRTVQAKEAAAAQDATQDAGLAGGGNIVLPSYPPRRTGQAAACA
jgi:hypothetical protein